MARESSVQRAWARPSVGDCGTGGTVGFGSNERVPWLIGKLVGVVPVARPYAHATAAMHALEHYRAKGDPIGEAMALNQLGWVEALLGQHEKAHEHCLAATDRVRLLDEHARNQTLRQKCCGLLAAHVPRHTDEVGRVENALLRTGYRAWLVEILDAHDQLPAGLACLQPRHQRGARAPEVKIPGRRGRESTSHVRR